MGIYDKFEIIELERVERIGIRSPSIQEFIGYSKLQVRVASLLQVFQIKFSLILTKSKASKWKIPVDSRMEENHPITQIQTLRWLEDGGYVVRMLEALYKWTRNCSDISNACAKRRSSGKIPKPNKLFRYKVEKYGATSFSRNVIS